MGCLTYLDLCSAIQPGGSDTPHLISNLAFQATCLVLIVGRSVENSGKITYDTDGMLPFPEGACSTNGVLCRLF
jgi:hypothetical protein